jgi:hypothetical protein
LKPTEKLAASVRGVVVRDHRSEKKRQDCGFDGSFADATLRCPGGVFLEDASVMRRDVLSKSVADLLTCGVESRWGRMAVRNVVDGKYVTCERLGRSV